MIDLDSLPPLCLDTANAVVERNTANHILEYAVLLSVNVGDKEAFNRNMSCLRPYYANIV
jgi:26S proteasome regulatory subunit N12